jgi:hypothetical protein
VRKRNIRFGVLVSALLLVTAASTPAQTKACSLNANSVIEYGRYQSSGWTFEVLIIPEKTPSECLVAYAAGLHRDYPGVRFQFFDGHSKELAKYVNWSRTGDDGIEWSDKWYSKHHIADLLPLLEGPPPCFRWVLKPESGDNLATFECDGEKD